MSRRQAEAFNKVFISALIPLAPEFVMTPVPTQAARAMTHREGIMFTETFYKMDAHPIGMGKRFREVLDFTSTNLCKRSLAEIRERLTVQVCRLLSPSREILHLAC